LARAICGHPTITRFDCAEDSPYESLDALYSALATLPALESVKLSTPLSESESTLNNPESLRTLLRVPALRSVCFSEFYFKRDYCQATANALMEGTAITNLEFKECSFSAGEGATMLANGFKKKCISVIH
jgi:hypothetical protein